MLHGGHGDDILIGGGGNNTFIFNRGDGKDTIKKDNSSAATINTVKFGQGITADSLTLGLGSLRINTGAAGDEIHIENFNPNDVYASRGIDSLEFADGSALTYEQLMEKGFDIAGTAGDDTVTGTNVADRINGLAGNDTLSGGEGNDTLFGVYGNDTIYGEAGDYIIARGSGSDVSDALYGDDGIML